MSAWNLLAAELDAWAEAGWTAAFWWRDDDAVEATPALARLLGLRRTLDVPLAIAAIPARARPDLADALRGETGIEVLQHGYAHANHRPAGERKTELGSDRDLWTVAREIAEGRGRMDAVFGEGKWLDVMVPPWNRIDAPVIALLPGLGFRGVSTYDARPAAEPVPELVAVNTHVDVIDWTGTREFAGDDACLGDAVAHLAAKRSGEADAGEATGLLTHHLAHDEASWDFIARFVAATAAHRAARWISARDTFPEPA
jgi:hypothetical protein